MYPISTIVTGMVLQLIPAMVVVSQTRSLAQPVASVRQSRTASESAWLCG